MKDENIEVCEWYVIQSHIANIGLGLELIKPKKDPDSEGEPFWILDVYKAKKDGEDWILDEKILTIIEPEFPELFATIEDIKEIIRKNK